MLGDLTPDLEAFGGSEAMLLGGEHVNHLASADDEVLQGAGVLVGQRPAGGLDFESEEGESLGIDLVGLGEQADGLGEIAGVARVDGGNRQTGGAEEREGTALKATGGFHEDDLGRAELVDVGDELVDAVLGVGEGPGVLTGQHGNIQGGFGNIDTDEQVLGHGLASWLQQEARSRRLDLVDTGSGPRKLFELCRKGVAAIRTPARSSRPRVGRSAATYSFVSTLSS